MEKKMGVVSDGWMRVFCLVLTAFAATAARAEVQIGRLYDVVVVGGGPAGIGAALAAAKTGAKTALVERDSVIGGTTVQAKVCDIGLFSAWKRPIIAGPAWDLVTNAVAAAHGTLPDIAAQRPDKWMKSCVRVDPEIYSRLAGETLRKAGVTVLANAEVSSVTRTADGWWRAVRSRATRGRTPPCASRRRAWRWGRRPASSRRSQRQGAATRAKSRSRT
jgi:NADPH-dependent 2,4-dienoyl-CoA reductase/sulfur reductase-like enzyme